jgi:predicted transcriptional regulator
MTAANRIEPGTPSPEIPEEELNKPAQLKAELRSPDASQNDPEVEIGEVFETPLKKALLKPPPWLNRSSDTSETETSYQSIPPDQVPTIELYDCLEDKELDRSVADGEILLRALLKRQPRERTEMKVKVRLIKVANRKIARKYSVSKNSKHGRPYTIEEKIAHAKALDLDGFSQEEIAETLGTSQPTVHRYLNDKVKSVCSATAGKKRAKSGKKKAVEKSAPGTRFLTVSEKELIDQGHNNQGDSPKEFFPRSDLKKEEVTQKLVGVISAVSGDTSENWLENTLSRLNVLIDYICKSAPDDDPGPDDDYDELDEPDPDDDGESLDETEYYEAVFADVEDSENI